MGEEMCECFRYKASITVANQYALLCVDLVYLRTTDTSDTVNAFQKKPGEVFTVPAAFF